MDSLSVVYRPRGRNLLHMATYAAPQTVNYIRGKLSDAAMSAMANQPDEYNEDDQWVVVYVEVAEAENIWKAVKIDRNRMAHRCVMVRHPEELRNLASIKLEGEGDELDESGQSELERAKISSRSKNPDRYPLHYAVEAGNPELADALLRIGALLNNSDRFGMTPLHTAAKCGDKDLVELLCSNGADLKLRDNTNSTALHVALDNGHQHLQLLLIPRLP